MKIQKFLTISIFLILVTTLLVSAEYSVSSPQLTQPGLNSANYNYGTKVQITQDSNACEKGQDFLIQVAPFGCTPAVVRSDLLEEQNVPVFCQLAATQINPLIDVQAINHISFKGKMPEGVSGIGFHPAKAAISNSRSTLLNSPVLENVGYAVIVLDKQKSEAEMPDNIQGTLTANIRYDIKNTFGIGKAGYYLPELTQTEWEQKFGQYGFWRNKGYLRAESISENSATIGVYTSANNKISTVTLAKGKTSSKISLPGFYCLAGMHIRLDSLENPKTRAKFNINGEIVEVGESEKFLENRCSVTDIEKQGLVQEVSVRCRDDARTENFNLRISPRIVLEIDGEIKEVEVGDYLYTTSDNEQSIYVGYIGTKKSSEKLQDTYIQLMAKPVQTSELSSNELIEVANFDKLTRDSKFSVGIIAGAADLVGYGLSGITSIIKYLDQGKSFGKVGFNQEITFPLFGGEKIKIIKFAEPMNKPFFEGQAEIESEVDKAFNLLKITTGQGIDDRIVVAQIKDSLSFLIQEFGEPLYPVEMEFEIVKELEDLGAVTTSPHEVIWGIEIPGQERKIQISEASYELDKGTYVHELFHAFYQSPNFMESNPDFIIEGLAKYTSRKYENQDKTNKQINEIIFEDIKEKKLNINPDKPFKDYEDYEFIGNYLYDSAAYYFFTQNLDKEKVREILTKGRSLQGEPKTFEELKQIYNLGDFNDPTVSLAKWTGYVVENSQITRIDANKIKQDYDNAMSDYRKIIESFPNAKENDHLTNDSQKTTTLLEQETFGEQTFFNAILLAKDAEQKKTMLSLCKEFKEKFSNSKTIIPECDDTYKNSNQEFQTQSVLINNLVRSISFEGIYEPSFEEFSVVVKVKDPNRKIQTYELTLNAPQDLSTTTNEFIELKKLTSTTATIRINVIPKDLVKTFTQVVKSKDKTLKKNEGILEGGYVFTLTEINLKKVAKISVLPKVDNTGTQANFSFNIGIEKRAIQLAPDEIEDRIESLKNTIKKWKAISSDLGKTVKTFNTACLATGIILTAKNFLDNTGGRSIARNKVMRSEGGWTDICKDAVSSKKLNGKTVDYSSINDCLLKNSDKIDNDVDIQYNALKDVSITEENKATETKLLAEKYKDKTIVDPRNPNDIKKIIDTKDIIAEFNKKGEENRILITQTRDLKSIENALKDNPSDELKKILEIQRYKILSEINANVQGSAIQLNFAEKLNNQAGLTNINIRQYGRKDSIQGIYDGGKTTNEGFENIPSNAFVQAIVYNNNQYLLELVKISPNEYSIENIYNSIGKKVSSKDDPNVQQINERFTGFKEFDKETYRNKFKDEEIKYFETEPYKGMPAQVPFDLQNGWYATMKQTLSGGGSIRTYEASGAVSSFYLCNVGENGKAEFNSGIRDDICQGYNPGTGQIVGEFPGLTKSETDSLVRKAISAINDAQKGYKSGVNSIRIGSQTIPVGNPEIGVPEMQCQDFMSPKDCNLLFNVCDPVICPSSRCNLGGTYHSSNVIQSGIIGSIALCLPNMKENIFVPVCLTGIKAGIDNLLSVFTGYQDCLQTQLDSGETIGICDELHSIYLCDFFWREALPFSETIIPRIFESLTGQEGTRGGGEYLGVQSAWDNAQSSVDYMSNYYGRDITNAFKLKVTQEVGGAVCKNFISANYPSGGEILDSLVEPASPPQYTAYFNEIPFTTATVPATSQYKVFYHIFAGQESKAFYRVYLKSPSGTSLYQTSPTLEIASGFINKDQYASQTKDFTAPTGYKELCINVNGEDNCGFKQVSTNFAIDYLEDKYLQEQAEKTDIKSQEECISGSPSLYSLAQPNLQEGITEGLNPELYDRGIIRICGTDNPGQGTDINLNTADARWQKVGTCDGETNKIKCWIDTKSVKDVIKTTDIENQTLGDVSDNYLDGLLSEGDYIDFGQEINKINELDNTAKTNYITNFLIGKAFFNNQKAKLYLIRGNAYSDLALTAYKIKKAERKIEWLGEPEEDEFRDFEGSKEERIEIEDTFNKVGINLEYIPQIKDCTNCGIGYLNPCGEQECNVIGDYLGMNCEFSLPFSCKEKIIEISPEEKIDIEKLLTDLGINPDYFPQIKDCTDCGKGAINFCGEQECGTIGDYIGSECEYRLFRIPPCQKKIIIKAPQEEETKEIISEKEFKCNEQYPGQCEVAKEIVSFSKTFKENNINLIVDKNIQTETGADCFEELILMQSMQESKISHCKNELWNGKSFRDDFTCDNNENDVLKGDEDKSIGIMQINIDKHKDIEAYDFNTNINFALDLLFENFDTRSKSYGCKSKSYSGWQRALRFYNGWNTDCSKGDINYVENVLSKKNTINNLFGNVCGDGIEIESKEKKNLDEVIEIIETKPTESDYTIDLALNQVNKYLKKYGNIKLFSVNDEIKKFVIKLHTQKDNLLDVDEFDDLTGGEFFDFNLEDDLEDLKEILLDKKLKQRIETETKIVTEKEKIITEYPILEFEDGTGNLNILYQYSSTGWKWSFVKEDFKDGTAQIASSNFGKFEDQLTNEEKIFVKNLENKNYQEGLKSLIDRTIKNQEGGTLGADLTTKRIGFSPDRIFYFNQDEGERLYFKKGTNNWEISFDRQNWIEVNSVDINILTDEGENLVRALNGKEFYEGTRVIFNLDAEIKEEVEEKIEEVSPLNKDSILNAKSCSDCGTNPTIFGEKIQNYCDEEECTAIGNKLNTNCKYSNWNKFAPCKEIITKEIISQNLIFEFEDGTGNKNILYQFNSNVWTWSFVKEDFEDNIAQTASSNFGKFEDKLTNEEKIFIKNLENDNYLIGLKKLIDLTKTKKSGFWGGNDLTTNKVIYSPDGVFTISPDNEKRFYLKRSLTNWEISFDRRNWIGIEKVDIAISISNTNNLIKKLESKDIYEGALIIFEFINLGKVSEIKSDGEIKEEKITLTLDDEIIGYIYGTSPEEIPKDVTITSDSGEIDSIKLKIPEAWKLEIFDEETIRQIYNINDIKEEIPEKIIIIDSGEADALELDEEIIIIDKEETIKKINEISKVTTRFWDIIMATERASVLEGSYIENKKFIDELYSQEFLSTEALNGFVNKKNICGYEINEDMSCVYELLTIKGETLRIETPSSVSTRFFDIDSEIEQALKSSGSYSENKDFIDRLYLQDFLSEEAWNGFIAKENICGYEIDEDMFCAYELLILEKEELGKEVKKITDPSSVTARFWDINSAIKQIKTLSGKYSENKQFIDQLCFQEILSNDECDDIDGKGGYFEENMNFVKTLLINKNVLVIDPGHGGIDPGAISQGINEKNLVLGSSKRLKEYFEEKDFKILLTRNKDTITNINQKDLNYDGELNQDDELISRREFALKNNAKYFISIHSDKFIGQEEVSGARIYFYCDCSNAIQGDGQIDYCTRDLCNNKESTTKSYEYAQDMEKILEEQGFEVESIKGGDLGILNFNNPNLPAILVELGFMGNENDLQKLIDYSKDYVDLKIEPEKITKPLSEEELSTELTNILKKKPSQYYWKDESPEKWSNAIINAMKEAEIPLEKKYLAIILTIIESESDFRIDPSYLYKFSEALSIKIEEFNRIKKYGATRFQKKYETELSNIDSDKKVDNFINNLVWWEKIFIQDLRPTSLGPMQIQVIIAQKLAQQKYNQEYSDEEMRERLYTLNDGILYGTLNLKNIISIYSNNFRKELIQKEIEFIVSDYNAGTDASRNAAFQNQLNEINLNLKFSNTRLKEDGILGDKTLQILGQFLVEEKRTDLIGKEINTEIRNLVKEKSGSIIDAKIPNLIYTNAVGTKLSVERYVQRSLEKYNNYCKELDC